MARENLLYSEIQSLSNDRTGRNDTIEYENDFDDHLNQLVNDLRNKLEALRGQGAAFLKDQKNLTGVRPTDFNSLTKVAKLRSDGIKISRANSSKVILHFQELCTLTE